MANEIYNRLTLRGNAAEIQECINFIKGDDTVIDCEKIIPIPIQLKNTSVSTNTNECILYYLLKDGISEVISNVTEWRTDPPSSWWNKSQEEFDKMYQQGKQYYQNYLDLGYTTWYKWAWDNWGTCSTYTYDQEIRMESDDCAHILFFTGWTGIKPVIDKIQSLYPNINMEYITLDLEDPNNLIESDEEPPMT